MKFVFTFLMIQEFWAGAQSSVNFKSPFDINQNTNLILGCISEMNKSYDASRYDAYNALYNHLLDGPVEVLFQGKTDYDGRNFVQDAIKTCPGLSSSDKAFFINATAKFRFDQKTSKFTEVGLDVSDASNTAESADFEEVTSSESDLIPSWVLEQQKISGVAAADPNPSGSAPQSSYSKEIDDYIEGKDSPRVAQDVENAKSVLGFMKAKAAQRAAKVR